MQSATFFAAAAMITGAVSVAATWRFGNKQLTDARLERATKAAADEQSWIRDQNLVDMRAFLTASFDGAIRPYFEHRAERPDLDAAPYRTAWEAARRVKLQAISGFRLSAPEVVTSAVELHEFEEEQHRKVFADEIPSREDFDEGKVRHQQLRQAYVTACRQVLGIAHAGPELESRDGVSGEARSFAGPPGQTG